MLSVTTDPSREVTTYWRIGRDGDLYVNFFDMNGIPFNISTYSFAVHFKQRKGSDVFLVLTSFSGGLTISDTSLIISLTSAQTSTFREQTYLMELLRGKSGKTKTWLIGDAVFHYGKFDGVSSSSQTFINSFDDMISITIDEASSGSGVSWIDWDASTNVLPTDPQVGVYYTATSDSTTLLGPDGSVILKGIVISPKVSSPGTDLSDLTKWAVFSTYTS